MKLLHLALLVGCASILVAQARRPSSAILGSASKLLSIKVTGSKRYTPAQVIAASGLQLGQTVNDEDLKGVSQHLGESGAFSDVAYTFQSSAEGIKVDLQVTDSNPFVPVRFENFVWFSDQELLQKLSEREPLFQGELPVSGNLADQVSEALQGLAIERKLTGRVDYLRAGTQDGPTEAFEFSITSQPIVVRKIDFTGAGPEELPTLQIAARHLTGRDYSRSDLVLQAAKEFLPIFLQHGYLKASIGGPQPKVVEETADETAVDVTFPVTSGLQYKVSTVQLSNYSNVFPVEKLRELIHLQPGKIADAVQTGQDVDALKRLYGSRGYMGVQVHTTPEMNDADFTAKYLFQFEEGSIYKMGDLEVRGLDSKASERIGVAWKLQAGQNYDSGYIRVFLTSIADQFPRDQWRITYRETPEDQDKVVDVSLRFEAIR